MRLFDTVGGCRVIAATRVGRGDLHMASRGGVMSTFPSHPIPSPGPGPGITPFVGHMHVVAG